MTNKEINDIAEENLGIIWQVIRDNFRPCNNWDDWDLFQTGFFALRRAIINFKPERKCKLSTVIYQYVYRELLSYCRTQSRWNRKNVTAKTIPEKHYNNLVQIHNIEAGRHILSTLSKEDVNLINHHVVDGKTLWTYGKNIGVKKSTASSRWSRLKNRIKKIYPELNQ